VADPLLGRPTPQATAADTGRPTPTSSQHVHQLHLCLTPPAIVGLERTSSARRPSPAQRLHLDSRDEGGARRDGGCPPPRGCGASPSSDSARRLFPAGVDPAGAIQRDKPHRGAESLNSLPDAVEVDMKRSTPSSIPAGNRPALPVFCWRRRSYLISSSAS